jgi:hypothetical protein
MNVKKPAHSNQSKGFPYIINLISLSLVTLKYTRMWKSRDEKEKREMERRKIGNKTG